MIKVIIEVRGGVVVAVHATNDLQYIVVDHDDDDSLDKTIIGQPNTPDCVDINLSLTSLHDADIEQQAIIDNHSWL